MTAAGSLNSGSRLTAAELRNVAPLAAYKGATESVTNSAALQNDDALFLSLLANATYDVDMFLAYVGGTQGSSDLKGAFAIPSGATWIYGYTSTGLSSSTPHVGFYESGTGTWNAGTAGAGVNLTFRLSGTIVTSAAGVLQFQWAQNTATAATATSVLPGSKLTAVQIA